MSITLNSFAKIHSHIFDIYLLENTRTDRLIKHKKLYTCNFYTLFDLRNNILKLPPFLREFINTAIYCHTTVRM